MAIPIILDWFAISDPRGIIAPLQNLGAAGPLTLTTSPYVYPKGSGFSRNVAITSANNLSGVNFTITGVIYSYVNGVGTFVVNSETLTGPNNDSVFGVNYYTQVNSITVSGAANGVTVTVGDSGTGIIKLDEHRANFKTSIYVEMNDAPDYTAVSLFGTNQLIEKPTYNGIVFDFDSNRCQSLSSAGTDTGQAITIPTYTDPIIRRFFCEYFTPSTAIYVTFGNATSSSGTYPGAAEITVLQQGLRS